jgi:HlyD family secretion protein
MRRQSVSIASLPSQSGELVPTATTFARLSLVFAIGVGVWGCSRPAGTGYPGYVEGEFVYLASSQPGQLAELKVARGQTAQAGALLFVLDSTEEIAVLDQARQQMLAASAQRADLSTAKRPEEIRVIEAQRAEAKADATRADKQYQRGQDQFPSGGISQQTLDDAHAAADSANAKLRELDSQLAVAHLPSRSKQIEAQLAAVRAAEALVAQAQWRLDQKSVHAPRGGLVYDTLYRAGEWVNAGGPVVRLLPPENVKVRFFVPETTVGSLKVGQSVRLQCDGCNEEVGAAISFISNQSEYTPPVIYSNDNRAKLVFLIEARPLLSDAPKLHPGQPVSVIAR